MSSKDFREELQRKYPIIPYEESMISAGWLEPQNKDEEKTITTEEELNLIFLFHRGEKLTQEQKKELLAIKEEMLPTESLRTLLNIAKECIESGKNPDEVLAKYRKVGPSRKVSMQQSIISENWEKSPEKNKEKEENKDEPEI